MNFQEKQNATPIKLFEFRAEYDSSNYLKNTNHKPIKRNSELNSSGKYRRKKNNEKTSDISKTPFCFAHWIPEVNDVAAISQDFNFGGSSSTKSEGNSDLKKVSKTRFKREGFQNIELKFKAHLENPFFFSNSNCIKMQSIQGHILSNKKYTTELTNIHHQEVKVSTFPQKIESALLPTDLPSAQSCEAKSRVVVNTLIQTVSQVNEIVHTKKIPSSCANKFEVSSLTCKKLASEESVPLNDPVFELIRQQRLSWWVEDDVLPNFKPNRFYERSQNDFYTANCEAKNSYTSYKSQRKFRVQKFEQWQSKMVLPHQKPQKLESEKRIVTKPKDKQCISWRNKFSDESELDDSGSSLDGSFLRPESDSSDSSDCESSTCSTPSYPNRSVPPTSSRIFGDSIAEPETMFLNTFRKQFWHSDLVRNADKHFIEDFGFTSVVLQALQCLCQYSEDGEI